MLIFGAKVLKNIIMRNSLSDAHPFSKVIFSLFIIFVSFIIFIIIGFLVAIPIFNINLLDIPDLLENLTNPDNLNFLKYLQTIQAIGLFIIPAFIIAYLFDKTSFTYLTFDKSINIKSLFLVLIIMLSALPAINFFAKLNSEMQFPDFLKGLETWMKEKETSAQLITEMFLKMDSTQSLFFNIFMIGILPAIGEELIFRGIFQRIFAEWTKNIHLGILIAAILFSGMHMQFYGFVPRLLLGLLFGYLFYWSGSIWVPIAGHFVNNTAAVVLYYFYAEEMSEKIDSFGISKDTYIFLIISILIVSYMLWMFYMKHKKITGEISG